MGRSIETITRENMMIDDPSSPAPTLMQMNVCKSARAYRAAMSNDAQRLRNHARDCLNVAKGTRDEAERAMLEDMAAELEAEATKIDAETAGISPITINPKQG